MVQQGEKREVCRSRNGGAEGDRDRDECWTYLTGVCNSFSSRVTHCILVTNACRAFFACMSGREDWAFRVVDKWPFFTSYSFLTYFEGRKSNFSLVVPFSHIFRVKIAISHQFHKIRSKCQIFSPTFTLDWYGHFLPLKIRAKVKISQAKVKFTYFLFYNFFLYNKKIIIK